MDNTKYGWGLRVLSGHRTPEIGSKAQSLVNTYRAIFTGDTSKKVVYLTFDEGYEAGHTGQILDILKDNGVEAAFFITGTFLKSNPELVARTAQDGHIIGNHTVNHPSLPTLNYDEFFNEVVGLAQDYQQQTGRAMSYLRPPRGEYSERTLCMARVLGYRTVFWSIAMADWVPLKGGPEEAYTTVMSRLHPGAVILLHAVSPDNVQILDRLIKDIRAEGYEFGTLDEVE
ncbi:polysaccharide deacetylase family protein [Coprothermobacteraceae bacterium]|nr:polysaccharide deacetylase family protein [Coprothermobacteraceae bacterium]